ncbi:MAG: hypothetical protein J7501_05020 [Bdellovibrio sp.]|nr:hypothetical protein [Bdellovibrio sp.]
MKTLGWVCVVALSLNLVACLDNQGGSEVPSSNNTNNNFDVETDPNNSGPSPTPSVTPTPAPSSLTYIVINKGEALTDSRSLNVDLGSEFYANFVKISESSDCSGGTWGPFQGNEGSQVVVSSKTNQSVPLSAQFKDVDGRVSDCVSSSIVIDEAGPQIIFAKYPSTTVEEGSDVEIVFTVTDDGAGVDSVTCEFAGVAKTCGAGSNTVKIPKMVAGTYTLAVSATDKLNHASGKSITFQVSSMYKQMVQNVGVTAANKVDILIVIDNSGSMEYEQKNMASRVKNLLSVIKGLDWQIAVTTTDPRDITLGDGRLVQLSGKKGQYILTSAMTDADAQATLGATLQRSETGSGSEQGIYVTYRAIERSLAASGGNVNFIRPDAQLAALVISDEDESANATKNDPQSLLNFISSTYKGQKAFSFHSIITRPGDTACKATNGYAYGYRYEQISKLTGGVIGDVCAADYAAQVQGIAEGVRKTLKTITLSCTPVVDSLRSVTVLKDGQAYTAKNSLQGLNLVFDDMLPVGQYQVYYSCVK